MTGVEPVLEIARRIALRSGGGYAWFVLIPAGAPEGSSPADVQDELEIALASSIRMVTAGSVSVHEFVSAVASVPGDLVLVSGLDEWTDENWSAFDIQRSALERVGAIVLMLSSTSVLRLCNHAPNIRSFVGGSFFQLAPGGGMLSELERQRRIDELEAHYKLSSDDIIERAKRRDLGPDPNFVEWLVLLGRGDLV